MTPPDTVIMKADTAADLPASPPNLWLSAASLALGPAAALGFARFAYALLLPAMQSDLGWNYAQSGLINTANAVGYLLGALIAAPVIRAWGVQRVFSVSLMLTAASVAATALTGNFFILMALRLIPGATGATVLIAGAALAAQLATRHNSRAALILGIYYAGVGLGIMISGFAVPLLLASHGSWRGAWVLLGALSAVPVITTAKINRHASFTPDAVGHAAAHFPWRRFGWSLTSYFLLALGYIGYMTFMIAFLRMHTSGAGSVMAFWMLLGLMAMLSFKPWNRLLQTSRDGRMMAWPLAVLTVGTLLPVLSMHTVALYVSAALFGISFLVPVTATTALVRLGLPQTEWPRGIALFTVVFGVGQSIGPFAAGFVADHFGGLAASIAFSAAVVAAAALCAVFQHDVVPRQHVPRTRRHMPSS
jgi:predicted MFS family arabinose efflux permease